MQPKPQTRPALKAVDETPVTEIAIVNPSVLLVESEKRLSVLLSRDTIIEPEAIHLFGSRLIHIPLGWRLRFLRFFSWFNRGRLPDEIEFRKLDIQLNARPAKAKVDRMTLCNVPDPSLLLPLTGSEYKTLIEARGRFLHAWIAEHFGTGIGTKAQKPCIRDRRWAA
jgi:hypothetical protein